MHRERWVYEAAEAVPDEPAVSPTGYTRYLLTLAHAQTKAGRDAEALQTMIGVEKRTPEWLRYQALGRVVVEELIERRRRVPEKLRDLAAHLAIE